MVVKFTVVVNHVSIMVILIAFGIANLAISQSHPFCGVYGYPPLSTWALVTGTLQLVFGVLGVWTSVALWMEADGSTGCSSKTGQAISIGYFSIAHIMNVTMAIVGSVSIAQSLETCRILAYPTWQTALGSIITAFALAPVYLAIILITWNW